MPLIIKIIKFINDYINNINIRQRYKTIIITVFHVFEKVRKDLTF